MSELADFKARAVADTYASLPDHERAQWDHLTEELRAQLKIRKRGTQMGTGMARELLGCVALYLAEHKVALC